MWCIGEHFFPRHGTQQLKRETCMMQRRVSNVFVAVVATFLLVLAAISPASADVGVRVAPRPSSTAPGTPSDTAKTASTLRNAQRRSTGSYTGSYRDAELLVDAPRYLVDAQPRVVKSRGVAFDGPDAALDPDDLEPDDLGSLVYGETQVDAKFRLPIQARIINGVEVFPEKKYRWMLGVVAVSSSGTESFRCGATLISPRYALSASHCYFSTGTNSNLGSSTIALKVGAHDIDEPEKTVEVIQIIGNPAYDGSTFENDITVLRLAEDLDIAEYPPAGSHRQHEPTRTRPLLAHRKEIRELAKAQDGDGGTLVPLKIYFKDGRAKLLIGVAEGRKKGDKRQDIAKKEAKRDIERELRRRR